MRKSNKFAGIPVACFLAAMVAWAGTLPRIAEAQIETAFVSIEKTRSYPVRGQSRDQVRRKHGDPDGKKSPVGDPPISSWVYPEFIVYFERDLVITTVASEDGLPSTLGNIQ
jgi:hypothetical protein